MGAGGGVAATLPALGFSCMLVKGQGDVPSLPLAFHICTWKGNEIQIQSHTANVITLQL